MELRASTLGAVKSGIKRAILKARLLELPKRLVSRGVILRYHAVRDDPDSFGGLIGTSITHATAAFRRQMEALAREYRILSMDDLQNRLERDLPIPSRAVAVTFDDGFSDNLEIVAPILNELGVPGTFYIISDCANGRTLPWFVHLRHALWTTPRHQWTAPGETTCRPVRTPPQKREAFVHACRRCAALDRNQQQLYVGRVERELDVERPASNGLMLTWDQIRRLQRMGHIIGSHTRSHPNLAYVPPASLRDELVESKRRLEHELGTPVVHFSYPNPALEPNWNQASHDAVHAAGYKTAVTCAPGSIRRADAPLTLKRMWVPPEEDSFRWDLSWTALGRVVSIAVAVQLLVEG